MGNRIAERKLQSQPQSFFQNQSNASSQWSIILGLSMLKTHPEPTIDCPEQKRAIFMAKQIIIKTAKRMVLRELQTLPQYKLDFLDTINRIE
jgi:hypothetical protein